MKLTLPSQRVLSVGAHCEEAKYLYKLGNFANETLFSVFKWFYFCFIIVFYFYYLLITAYLRLVCMYIYLYNIRMAIKVNYFCK